MSILRSIKQIVNSVEQSEGAGARVRRSIGTMTNKTFTPFIAFDHFYSSGANGFPEHPHSGQETITMILKGRMAHEDFTGSKGVLYAGDLQFMTAGRGVVHSEMPIPEEDGSPTVGMQLWVDLPSELKSTAPRYRDLRSWEIPQVKQQDGKLKIKVISGKSYGVESSEELAYTPVHFYHYEMKPGAEFRQELNPEFNYFLYVIQGDKLVLNDKTPIKEYHNVFFNVDGDLITGKNSATEGDTNEDLEFILVGGQRLNQNVVQHGPFVATSREGIIKCFQEYSLGVNGFDKVRNWKTLISKGVTQEMIDGPLNGSAEQREKDRLAYLAKQKPQAS